AEQLTPHELQIALLVAQGMTNREAAAALFLSPKTIEYHLGQIYRKLDVRGRAQLARLMAMELPEGGRDPTLLAEALSCFDKLGLPVRHRLYGPGGPLSRAGRAGRGLDEAQARAGAAGVRCAAHVHAGRCGAGRVAAGRLLPRQAPAGRRSDRPGRGAAGAR